MRNLIGLIQRFYVFLLFLVLQIFALYVLFNSNNYHKAEFVQHSKDWTGSIYSFRTQLKEYWILDEINDRLSLENAILRSQLPENVLTIDTVTRFLPDSVNPQRYMYKNAHVENVTINRESNYVMIDKGSSSGVEREMGVIANGSIVGVVTSVSNHFSVVMPILNNNFVASVRMKDSRDFGLLAWQGGDPDKAIIKDLPKHVKVSVGDTVVTSGSGYYPGELFVGIVDSMDDRPEENFHRIVIRLATDYRKLDYVQVVKDLFKEEKEALIQAEENGADNN
ncbi:MAG: rod shape-determining protein MreC [Flavobacteriales bacterium]